MAVQSEPHRRGRRRGKRVGVVIPLGYAARSATALSFDQRRWLAPASSQLRSPLTPRAVGQLIMRR